MGFMVTFLYTHTSLFLSLITTSLVYPPFSFANSPATILRPCFCVFQFLPMREEHMSYLPLWVLLCLMKSSSSIHFLASNMIAQVYFHLYLYLYQFSYNLSVDGYVG